MEEEFLPHFLLVQKEYKSELALRQQLNLLLTIIINRKL